MTATPPVAPAVVAFVYNPATHDTRVLREAETLAGAGYDVTLVALWRPGLPREERRGAVRVLRLPFEPLDDRVVRLLGALGSPRRWLRGRRAERTATPAGSGPPREPAARSGRPGGPATRLRQGLARAVRRGFEPVRWPLIQRAWYGAVRDVLPAAAVWHAHDLSTLPLAARFARERGGRLVYDSHELYLESGRMAEVRGLRRRLLERSEGRLARRADAVVTVNEGIAAELWRRYRLARTPLVVMNCPPRWHPEAGEEPPPSDRLRATLALPTDRRILLYQGAFSPDRGLERIPRALLAPGLEAAVAVFLGYGPLRDELEALAADPRFGGRLFVLDAVPPDELLEWTASADVSLIPTQPGTLNNRLTSPNKLFESLAAGVPVVVSRLPVVERLVADLDVGELVGDPTDPAQLAAAIGRILALSPDDRAALRRRCRRAALERYNWEIEGAHLVGLYARLAPLPPAGAPSAPPPPA
ncbi:MAG: hypothetical protein A2X23_04000 [Chloroflexi bacterium GWC2_73_18]|nr:MAG: hypothetical protein A2X23_04000 [Chloroflexi bacterium GWC2_73_18]